MVGFILQNLYPCAQNWSTSRLVAWLVMSFSERNISCVSVIRPETIISSSRPQVAGLQEQATKLDPNKSFSQTNIDKMY